MLRCSTRRRRLRARVAHFLAHKVQELYGHTDTSVKLDDLNLSKRRLAVDHVRCSCVWCRAR